MRFAAQYKPALRPPSAIEATHRASRSGLVPTGGRPCGLVIGLVGARNERNALASTGLGSWLSATAIVL